MRIVSGIAAVAMAALASGCATPPPERPRPAAPRNAIEFRVSPGEGADAAFASDAEAYAKSELVRLGYVIAAPGAGARRASAVASCEEKASLDEWRVCASSVDVTLAAKPRGKGGDAVARLDVEGPRAQGAEAARKALAEVAGKASAAWIDGRIREGK